MVYKLCVAPSGGPSGDDAHFAYFSATQLTVMSESIPMPSPPPPSPPPPSPPPLTTTAVSAAYALTTGALAVAVDAADGALADDTSTAADANTVITFAAATLGLAIGKLQCRVKTAWAWSFSVLGGLAGVGGFVFGALGFYEGASQREQQLLLREVRQQQDHFGQILSAFEGMPRREIEMSVPPRRPTVEKQQAEEQGKV